MSAVRSRQHPPNSNDIIFVKGELRFAFVASWVPKMFDSVRNNKKIVQGFLVLITLPFALWGVESYVRDPGRNDEVATVGDSKISLQELQGSLNEQQDRLRQQLGGRVDGISSACWIADPYAA